MVCATILLMVAMTPLYIVNKLEMKLLPGRNNSIFGLTFTADRETVEKISLTINNFVIPCIAFIVIIICTVILVVSLKRRTGWLQTIAKSAKVDFSIRNQRVVKMVVMISTLFIACFVPVTIISMVVAYEPRFNIGGEYIRFSVLFAGLGLLVQAVNSSLNIFIYYSMSTKYRDTFKMIFGLYKKRHEMT